MSKILKPFKQSKEARKKEITEAEQAANAELETILAEFQQRHGVRIVPTVVLRADAIRGIRPVTDKLECVSNKRFIS